MSRTLRIAGTLTAGVGVVLLGLNIFLGGKVNFTLPLVFLMLGAAFLLLVFLFAGQWAWSPILYIPGCVLLSLGLIFLLNVITSDWNSWAYAWLLILTGLGLGITLANRSLQWRKEFTQAGIGLVILGTSLFAIFGVIAGGLVIQIMAPVLLILGGLALRWLRPELLRSGQVAQAEQPTFTVKEPQPASQPALIESEAGRENYRLVEPLSERELQVLKMIDQGLSNQEIATKLVLAQSTVKTHINNIYGKLGVQTRVQAVNRARDLALFEE